MFPAFQFLHNIVAFNVITFGAFVVVVIHLAIVWSLGVPRRLVAHGSCNKLSRNKGLPEASGRDILLLTRKQCHVGRVLLFRRSERHETRGAVFACFHSYKRVRLCFWQFAHGFKKLSLGYGRGPIKVDPEIPSWYFLHVYILARGNRSQVNKTIKIAE